MLSEYYFSFKKSLYSLLYTHFYSPQQSMHNSKRSRECKGFTEQSLLQGNMHFLLLDLLCVEIIIKYCCICDSERK